MRSYLRSHNQQVHENESTRRFQCRYCNKRFVRACHMKTHEKIHTGKGEVLPPGESSAMKPVTDSDSNSNSNASFLPERKSSITSTSSTTPNHGLYSRSNTNSPHISTPSLTSVKSEVQWNGNVTSPSTSGTQTAQAQAHQPTSWQYWTGTHYSSQSAAAAVEYDHTGWSQCGNSYYYSPLVNSDVNWTEPLSESSTWHQPSQGQQHAQSSQGHGYSSPQVKVEGCWGDSSSNGFHHASNAAPPSASVQDLWTELHYEEMKWLPETSTVYTADGIPMITELTPFDGFSYTEMLNNATADLPLFGTSPSLPISQDGQGGCGEQEKKLPGNSSQEEGATVKSKKAAKGGWNQQGEPLPGRNAKGRGKGKLTAEAKHKLKLSFAKRVVVPESDLDSLSSSPKTWEGSEDGEESAEYVHCVHFSLLKLIKINSLDPSSWFFSPDALVTCKSCKEDVVHRDLLEHIRSHLSPGQRTCDVCQRTYCNSMTLREHIHIHYNLKPHKCSLCEEKFSTKYSLKTHEVFSHEEGKSSVSSNLQKLSRNFYFSSLKFTYFTYYLNTLF